MASTALTTIIETVNLDLTNVALDTDPTQGSIVLNGTLSYSQSVTGNYSADGKTFTPTSYGSPTNISVTNLATSGGLSGGGPKDNTVLNDTFGNLSQSNRVDLTPGSTAFDNVGIEVTNSTGTGFQLKVYNGGDGVTDTGTGSTYDLLTLNIRENQVPVGNPINVDTNGRVDFVQSVSVNSGTGANIVQYDYQNAKSGSFSLHSVTGYTKPSASNNATPGVTDTVVCYSKGTHLKARAGDVKVEDLKVGDMLLTAEGKYKPVVWIGFNTIDCRLQKNKQHAYPIRISEHAFGYNLPIRDLFVSPLHSIYVNGVMIPAIHLVNGTTITQDQTESLVTYYHVELPTHDAVFAEGLAAETYLDTTPENRRFFEQRQTGEPNVFEMNAQFPSYSQDTPVWQHIWDTQGYAPLIQEGPVLEAVKNSLKEHAALAKERHRLAA